MGSVASGRYGRNVAFEAPEIVLADVAAWVAAADSVSVLTGAGISTDSGIPDFRGPRGLWTRDPGAERLFTYDHYVNDSGVRRRAWRERLNHPAWDAKPNAGHRALTVLERDGRLRGLVTQNIDGLHQAAGSSPRLVHELHGTIHEVACLDCDRRAPTDAVLDRVRAGEEDPPCLDCGGVLKSATISFGQALVPEVLERSVLAARTVEVFLAVGSSLTVQPAASLCDVAVSGGARLVIINAQATPYDDVARASGGGVLRTPIGVALPVVCG